ncbi:hypothetical protein N7466_006532 [Penicillium verhagenii]|uniref:uncharacterized protein n=1 Tax=Penicillium verhagenii TaxID=1562060 RepID=UPI0025456CE2|nr:uncharacterized protein N7466_006532 [Penicillium verhagenii]KAJ5931039.1 hypothetical protein N7466_006532 [Penicillium verhagenii]
MGSVGGLTPNQVQLIKATVPVLSAHGNTITSVFYENVIRENPVLNNIFNIPNQRNGNQPRALAGALFAYASNIDNLGALTPAVELICQRHASLYIQPDSYKIVGKYLLEAMAQVLGDALTPEILDAWTAAYNQLADIMIGREHQIYEQSQGWTDWRDFEIKQKVPESEDSDIVSFYLHPVDGKPLPAFKPGQYISVQVYVPELKYLQPRQYSLSHKHDPEFYRISVKREKGLALSDEADAIAQPGYVSNLLHDKFNPGDKIKVSHPAGDFFYSGNEAANPIVLISAGVGLTPLTSIVNTLTSKPSEREIHYIHGSRTSDARAFTEYVTSLKQHYPSLRTTFFTSQPSAKDKEGVDYAYAGRVDLSKLSSQDLFIQNPATEYYICGPESFMTDMESSLKAQGVSDDRIKMERFGTGGIPQ